MTIQVNQIWFANGNTEGKSDSNQPFSDTS